MQRCGGQPKRPHLLLYFKPYFGLKLCNHPHRLNVQKRTRSHRRRRDDVCARALQQPHQAIPNRSLPTCSTGNPYLTAQTDCYPQCHEHQIIVRELVVFFRPWAHLHALQKPACVALTNL